MPRVKGAGCTYMPPAGWGDGLLRGKLDGGHLNNNLQAGVLELLPKSLPCRISDGLEG